MINLGMIDIYKELGERSKALENVEQFLLTIICGQKNSSLVLVLEKRSKIKISAIPTSPS